MTKEYDKNGEPCFRYIHTQHYPDPGAEYRICSFCEGVGGAYGWAIRKDFYERVQNLRSTDPGFSFKSGETADYADGAWHACYQTNPFFKAGTRDNWKQVTPENATEHERRQIERMIRLTPERGKFHKLLVAAWTI